ncbi:MAG: N-acetylmuramoyl-L-alanine amidase, partial [Myxococcota bacterium]|nr:N-acetylmuramoyl-L-alanine amidase [Myxococcota bacterium]
GADLFLSVHANALEDQRVAGVETYYLDMTDDRYALRLASVENQIHEEKVSEIQFHLANLANQLSTDGSRELAGMIHKAAFRSMRLSVPAITKDLGVKSSLFYVLLGTRMPAVLLEAGFITNPRQAQVLKNRRYGKKLSRELADGILAFLKKRETKYATE